MRGKDATLSCTKTVATAMPTNMGKSHDLLPWDDRHHMLSIGNRSGAYPAILTQRTFKIVLVKPEHGVGIEPASTVDRTVDYDGHTMRIDFKHPTSR